MNKLPVQLGKLGHLRGIVEHLIVIGLLGIGSILATTLAPDETALQYELHIDQVDGLSVATIRLVNSTKRAIEVDVQHLEGSTVRFEPAAGSTAERTGTWSGFLSPQQRLLILLVMDGDLPDGLAAKLVRAKFKVVEESTGAVVQKTAELRELSMLSLSRSIRYGAWFMAPFIASGLLFLAVIWVQGRRAANPTTRPPETAPLPPAAGSEDKPKS